MDEDITKPRVWGWSAALLMFCISFVFDYSQISSSTSSTAAIGYIFLPFLSAFLAIPSFAVGWCAGYFLAWRKSPDKQRRMFAYGAGVVPVVTAIWIVTGVSNGMDLQEQVARIDRMNSAQLDAVMMQPKWARNKFVLSAIAENPNASALTLHRIATSDAPGLHDRMGSLFAVLGKNRRGLAVMRVVARHPNTAPEDLEILARSPNEDVLGDAALNPKLSEATLRRLAKHGGYSVNYGLAHNPRTPPDVLATH